MNKSYLLQKLAFASIVGVISTTANIAIAPAQAFVFISDSTLNWIDNTSEFFSDVQQVDGDTLQITSTGSDIYIEDATGSFIPAFTSDTVDQIVNDPIVANFTYFGTGNPTSTGNVNRYVLQNTIEWDFGERTLISNEGANVSGNLKWVVPAGAEFEITPSTVIGEFIEIDLCKDTCSSFPYFEFDGDTFGAPPPFPNDVGEVVMGVLQDTKQNTLDFFNTSIGANGSYDAGGVVVTSTSVPEPTFILGLFTIAGLGLSLKHKY